MTEIVRQSDKICEYPTARPSFFSGHIPESLFKALVQNSSDLITILDRQGRVLFVSPSVRNVLGYEAEELNGEQSFDLIHTDDLAERRMVFETLAADPHAVVRREFRFRHKNGSWRTLETVARTFFDEENNVKGVLINSRDVTQRKRDELQLKIYTARLEQGNHEFEKLTNSYRLTAENLEKSRAELIAANNFIMNVMDSMVDFVVVTDMNLRMQRINSATMQLSGYKEKELVGQSLNMLSADHEFNEKSVNIIRKRGFVHNLERLIVCKNGRILPISLSMSVIKNGDGEEGGIVFVGKDVTEIVKARQSIETANERLRQSNRELQDFAYVASHDLQEPLRKVQAFGDRLQRKCAEMLNDEGKDYVKRMRDAAGRMQILINDLLTFSRVATKAQPFKEVDLKKVAAEVVSDLEIRIEQTGGRVEIEDLPLIDADAVQMRQLLQNLIGNALKFHRAEEKPVVRVYAETLHANGASFQMNGEEIHIGDASSDFCRLIVVDNGIGFEEKYLDRIFTVFQRLHGRSEYEGSGIGLAVCRKIVERHGGAITAKSKPGAGAAFLIDLPVRQENENHES